MADGIHNLDETLVRVYVVEKLLLLRSGYLIFHLLMGEVNQNYMMELLHTQLYA